MTGGRAMNAQSGFAPQRRIRATLKSPKTRSEKAPITVRRFTESDESTGAPMTVIRPNTAKVLADGDAISVRRQQSYRSRSRTAGMELQLTSPRGLYYLLLVALVSIEIIVGGIEIAQYFGLLFI